MKFSIDTTDKPHLERAMKENPKLAQEVIGTFVSLMEESFDGSKGLPWTKIPAELHRDLTFNDLIHGILRGSLDLRAMNPDAFDALKIEVHPLSMLSPRKNWIDGSMRRYNWRGHFKMPEEAEITEETISNIFRKLLRYAKYIKVDDLYKAMEANQLTTFRGLGERSVALLPMVPALRYQKARFGDLHVGKFYDDIGFLDCGDLGEPKTHCPACTHPDLTVLGEYTGCLNCNAGFRKEP